MFTFAQQVNFLICVVNLQLFVLDCGWITGHSYVVYGPLLNGLTSVIFEGVPTYPQANRLWAVAEKYQVNNIWL